MLIYLFRDKSTDSSALTMDVTGRKISPVPSSTVWLFVDTAEFKYAVRQVRMTGSISSRPDKYYLLQRKLVDAPDFHTRRDQSPEGLAGKACQPPQSRVLFGFGHSSGYCTVAYFETLMRH